MESEVAILQGLWRLKVGLHCNLLLNIMTLRLHISCRDILTLVQFYNNFKHIMNLSIRFLFSVISFKISLQHRSTSNSKHNRQPRKWVAYVYTSLIFMTLWLGLDGRMVQLALQNERIYHKQNETLDCIIISQFHKKNSTAMPD